MKRIWLPTLVTLWLGLLGCGGGDEPGSDGGPHAKDAKPTDTGNDPASESNALGASTAGRDPLELKYVLPDYDVAVVAHPRRAWASKFAEQIERKDFFPQLFLEEAGVDLRTVERALVLTKAPPSDADSASFDRPVEHDLAVAVLWFSEPVDVDEVLGSVRGLSKESAREHNGVTYYQREWVDEAFAFPDPTTMYFASPTEMKRLIDAKEPQASPLVERLATQSLDADVVVVMELADHRDAMQVASEAPGLALAAVQLLELGGRANSVVAKLDLSHSTLLDVVVEAVDEEAATAMETASMQGAKGLLSIVQGLKAVGDPEQGALLGVAENVLQGLELSRDGAMLRAAAPAPDDWSPVLTVLNEGIAAAEKAARRAKRFNGLKKIGAALIDFHDIYGAFPAVAGFRDADGKPLLSWRVAILPMLGQGKLFDQFEKDEPWDSEHNLALLEKMPEAFRTPGVGKSGMTSLVAVVGANTGLGDLAARADVKAGIQGNVRFRDIIDGSSGTVLVVEANADMAVPWTKPADATFDDATIAALLEKEDDGGLMVLLADGYVAFLDRTIPPELFRQLLIRNDGEFPEKWFEYRK